MKRLLQLGIASLLMTACGSDGPNFGAAMPPTQTQQLAITDTEDGLVTLAAADVNGDNAAGAAFALTGTAELLFDTGTGASLGKPALATAGGHMQSPAAVLQRALLADCAVMTSNSIVWDNCTQDGFTIDGSISWTTSHVDVDLHLTGSEQGFSVTSALTSSMTVSASAIQGDMTISVSASGNGMQASETLHSEIDVTLADGCITSGTLTVTASGSGSGAVNGAAQIVWSGCHMALIRKG